ncbi:MAG: phytoene/squalene synthase family protein [Myxococcales bacterium]|nr:phytoene/squalene synthase family protein [Myxococcales bacterium]MCB9733244.1 phytoene/squalene synthase family protein [Deltaproteobacteria bacterium]
MSGAAALDPALVAACREVMARHARSFDRAAGLLPAATRDRVAVLYAFCRLVDDSVDEAPSAEEAAREIAALDAELRGDAAARPIVAAYRALGADIGAARELVRGVASDVGRVRVADDRELLRYAYRVAGTVGLMMCPVLGVSDARALPHAVDLGVGMQLTNICRDVLEDAGRDRVYLPETRLRAAGGSGDALVRGEVPRGLVAEVVLDVLALADRYYASADLGLRFIPPAPRQAILLASRLYRGIGTVLRRRGGDALGVGRAVVGGAEKALLAAVALAQNARPTVLGLGAPPAHDATLHEALAGLPGANARAVSPSGDSDRRQG